MCQIGRMLWREGGIQNLVVGEAKVWVRLIPKRKSWHWVQQLEVGGPDMSAMSCAVNTVQFLDE
jgi:hypothetical protein